MKIASVFDVFSGSSWYRGVLPAHALAEAGHEVRMLQAEIPKDLLDDCDVLQVHRLFQTPVLAAVRRAKRNGVLTVYDVDDDLWNIGSDNSSSDFWEQNKGRAVRVMRECDIVTTTNDYLAGILRDFHDDVRVIPNALAMDWAPDTRPHNGVVIGWAGAKNHDADINLIADVLCDVLDARPNARMEMAGCGEWLTHERIRHLPTVPIENYATIVSRFDISLAPLVDNRFNRCKSDLKFLEAAGLGIPTIASKVRPYAESMTHGVTGYLASNGKDWRRFLLRLIDEAHTRKTMGEAAYQWSQTRTIEAILPQWEAVWSTSSRASTTTTSQPESERVIA